jgi:serine/threonine-protein kinase HipA
VFTYAPAWLADPQAFALSPQLPLSEEPLVDGSSQRPVQWYFDNLLPEEAQRTLLAKDAKLDEADAFALLSYYGAESAGSLTLLAPSETLAEEARLAPLPEARLSQRIQALCRGGPVPAAASNAHPTVSVAGLQPACG